MIIYHGSKEIIKNPTWRGSHIHNDYGPAFYMTIDLEAAKSWACRNDIAGIVNRYHIPNTAFKKLKILDLTNKEKYSVLNWMAILMHFRLLSSSFIENNQIALDYLAKYYINVDEYDVIIGYRADDAYFRFPLRFISNDLAIEDLEDAFLSGHLGIQYAFMSKKAISLLKFNEAIECDEKYLGHHYKVISEASKTFDILLNKPKDPKKTYIFDLMRRNNEQ